MLNSSAIESGYAGRDPQGGFCDRSVYSFIEIVKKKSEGSSLFLKLTKRKRSMLKVKVKKKAKDEEGGKSENDEKRQCTMKWKRKSGGDLYYSDKRKERKLRITYLVW